MDGHGRALGMEPRWLVALAALSIVVLLLSMDLSIGIYDESIILYGASRINAGDVPYRDFWTMYGPGSFYALAALFRIFGEYAILDRLLDIAARTAIVLIAFLLVARVSGRAKALAAAIFVLGFLATVQYYGFPIFPAMAFALAAAYIASGALDAARPLRAAILAGVVVGVTTLFRHDLGFYTALACGAPFLAHAAVRRSQLAMSARPLVGFAAGVAVVTAPVTLALLLTVPASDLFRDLIQIPATVYPKVRALPFPAVWANLAQPTPDTLQFGDLVVYAPIVVAACAVALELRQRRNQTGPDDGPMTRVQTTQFLVLIGLMLLFFIKGTVRVSPIHMAPSIVMAIILTGMMAGRFRVSAWRDGLVGASLLALLVPVLGGMTATVATVGKALISGGADIRAACADAQLARLRCLTLDPDRSTVAVYLRANTRPGEATYIGTTRHDKLMINDLALYFLPGNASVTKWHDLHPGVQTTAPIQAEMIAAMTARPPRLIVLNSAFDGANEPNGSRLSSGVHLLDAYISAHYRPVTRVGTFTVLAQKPS